MSLKDTVKKLIDLQYTYEHIPAPYLADSKPTGYLYFKADEILPLLKELDKEINGQLPNRNNP